MHTENYTNYNAKEIHIYYVDMPYSVTSNVVENPDGSFTIYINSRLSYEMQLTGYLHEIDHIYRNDFDYHDDIHEIERSLREG